jgi:hypothetical protein
MYTMYYIAGYTIVAVSYVEAYAYYREYCCNPKG